ncbi:MAG: methyltransferase domain-containing protein [Clostridia bacterium]|nr:methyltransferase domain-containing protein [Clostridia bacterium]
MKNIKHLLCPVCQQALVLKENTLACPSGHTFDLAAKGYVNLLMSQDKNSKDPGDNKEMVQARKRFLDKGYYAPLATALKEILLRRVPALGRELVLLDAGCGDGYYTSQLRDMFNESRTKNTVYGMDISKEAIRLASGRNKGIQFVVASLFKIPIASQSMDFVLNAFAPSSNSEFKRVLRKDGHLITVIPGKKHLFELKSVLYDNPYENDEKEPELISFIKEDQTLVANTITLDNPQDIGDLLAMTPYYWRTPKDGLERLGKLQSLTITTEFIITVYSRHA